MPLGKVVGLGPSHIVLDGDPVGTQPPRAAPSHFRPMPIVAKRSPISATAELLSIMMLHSAYPTLRYKGIQVSPNMGTFLWNLIPNAKLRQFLTIFATTRPSQMSST